MFLKIIVSVSVFAILACSTFNRHPSEDTPPEIKAAVELRSLQFFMEQSHPRTGLVRDRAENFKATSDSNRIASLAATGFGMAVIANASTRGLVSPDYAREYVTKTLRFARDHVGRRKGWFYHFVDWETGARANGSEFSTIDTALFMAGALYAARVVKDPEASAIAYQLYNDMDFRDMLTDGGAHPKKKTISMAYWEDSGGYRTAQWDMYAEQMILLVLGLGHPVKPLPRDTWLAWDRTMKDLPNGEKMMGINGALFLHQYSQLFIDFRGFTDGYSNYHANSIVATQWHRELMKRDPQNKTLQAGFWGFSAGEAPDGKYEVYDPTHYSSIACIGCTVASAMFLPDVVLMDMVAWRNGEYGDKLWGRYGFTDSVDISRNWFSPTVLGITKGPEYLALANTHAKTSIWHDFMQIPEIKLGLERASKASRPLAILSERPSRVPASK